MAKVSLELDTHRKKLEAALLEVNRLAAKDVLTFPYQDLTIDQLLEELVVPVLDSIGAGWETGQYSLSQVYMSGKICEEILEDMLPPSEGIALSHPNIAMAVLEDNHLLGSRMVYSIMRASGLNLTNYGSMKLNDLINQVTKDKIEILLISVLMLPSALKVKDLTSQLKQQGAKTKIIVGGAPFRFDRELWKEVNADAFGEKASDAVKLTKQVMEQIS